MNASPNQRPGQDGAVTSEPLVLVRRKLWPVCLCWCLMMVATAVGAIFNASSFSPYIDSGVQGIFLGEFALAAIIGGLVGRTWIAGWLLSACLVVFATLICYCVDLYAVTYSATYSSFSNGPSTLVLCSFWPLLMLSACAPLIVMRGVRGWSLRLGEEVIVPRRTSNVEDLFLLSVIVASCISIAKWMEEFIPGFEMPQLFFIMGLFFGYSLLFVFPVVVITFRARNWGQRLIGWLAMTVVVMAACLTMAWLINNSFSFWQDLAYIAVGVPAAAITMMVGIVSFLYSGVRMTHFAPKSQSSNSQTEDLADDQSTRTQSTRTQSTRLQARLLTGLVVVCALLNVGALNFRNSRNLAFFRDVHGTSNLSQNQISNQKLEGTKIVGVTFASSATDLSLENYRVASNDIERISLAGTQITDAAIEKLSYFPKLKHLDLSNTAITNAGLENLPPIPSLTTLSIANTNIDFDVALRVSRERGVSELDVSGTGITDEVLAENFEECRVPSLKLCHNPVTDFGIAQLLKNPRRLRKLDLSDTSIDGSSLVSINCPVAINLDRTQVTDANLSNILRMQICKSVSIRGTGITPAVLPTLAAIRDLSLTLGEGQITETDIFSLPLGSCFRHLGFNDNECTGKFLRTGKIQFTSLDLSHSGITDSALQNMVRSNWISYINLSHTDITDAGLETLSCHELDVRHTKVTAAGIRKARNIGRILIDNDEFTPEELHSFRNSNVVIDGERSDFGL